MDKPVVRIDEARTARHFETVRALFEEYERSIGVDLCFQNFAEELRKLPGAYAPPGGRIFLAFAGERPVGCIALRPFMGEHCEMKRLYVVPEYRGRGIGRLLAESVVAAARTIGYTRMYLDTLDTMVEAQSLYASLGFRSAERYRHNPLPHPIFLSLDL